MAAIKVHILNFHKIVSHIQIVLENTSTTPHRYYVLNRWEAPSSEWTGKLLNKETHFLGKKPPRDVSLLNIEGQKAREQIQELESWRAQVIKELDTSIDAINASINGAITKIKDTIQSASSTYSFTINEDPEKIIKSWQKYWEETRKGASTLGDNCAVATQWFLTEFAKIPKPNLSNISLNHVALGIVWPSFIPCPVTLPGRVLSNAKFHIDLRNNPAAACAQSRLFLYTSMALATLAFSTSVFALAVAATVLTGGIAGLAITAGVGAAVGNSFVFFKLHNSLSAKNRAEELKKTDNNNVPDDPLSYKPVGH